MLNKATASDLSCKRNVRTIYSVIRARDRMEGPPITANGSYPCKSLSCQGDNSLRRVQLFFLCTAVAHAGRTRRETWAGYRAAPGCVLARLVQLQARRWQSSRRKRRRLWRAVTTVLGGGLEGQHKGDSGGPKPQISARQGVKLPEGARAGLQHEQKVAKPSGPRSEEGHGLWRPFNMQLVFKSCARAFPNRHSGPRPSEPVTDPCWRTGRERLRGTAVCLYHRALETPDNFRAIL